MTFADHWWALVLGGSSGFGLAAAERLSRDGMNIVVVHRDRRSDARRVQPAFDEIAQRVQFRSYNVDALSDAGRAEVLDDLADTLGDQGRVRVLLHSIALGNLKRVLPGSPEDALLGDEDWTRTVHAMGTSLATWTQDLHRRRLFTDDARILGLTSEGNRFHWPGYGAVSAAKAALHAVVRALAWEGAPHGIRANLLQPGVTDTPALRAIPGSEGHKEVARRRNPFGRLTTPSEVADVIALLCTHEARWINGALIPVDGGERLSV